MSCRDRNSPAKLAASREESLFSSSVVCCAIDTPSGRSKGRKERAAVAAVNESHFLFVAAAGMVVGSDGIPVGLPLFVLFLFLSSSSPPYKKEKMKILARLRVELLELERVMARVQALLSTILPLLLSSLFFNKEVGALKAIFTPSDLIPILPHSVAWPLLNTLHNAVDLLPEFVGAVSSEDERLKWNGTCFLENEAYIEYTEPKKEGQEGGGILHIETNSAHSWTCLDLYVFATPYRVTWDYYFTARKHTLKIDEWEEGELAYVKKRGFSVFLMPAGMLGTLVALWDVLPIFSNSGWGEGSNIAFLQSHMGIEFSKRPQPWVTDVNTAEIHSGDFLALSKIRGRWGGFETLEKWVTGAQAGHTAVCLRDEDDKLWVGESGHQNEAGEEVIVILPWEEWWALQLVDDANCHIALLPLHPDMRSKFNVTAAWDYARRMNGLPYGYHNMIFSWIDTRSDNYPPPLDANLVASVILMWTRLQPDYASNMWNEALNKRLGTEGLDLPSVMVESEKQGIPFEELLAIPERDDWKYSDGYSTTCVAFILQMYKEAGLFGSLSSSIQVTEFTIRDAYMLNFFEDDVLRLPSWCNATDPSVPFCQILGEYQMELPGYNTLTPYAHMDEACPTLPPAYTRPDDC